MVLIEFRAKLIMTFNVVIKFKITSKNNTMKNKQIQEKNKPNTDKGYIDKPRNLKHLKQSMLN